MDLISGAVLLAGFVLPLVIVALIMSKTRHISLAFLFLFLLMADYFLTGFPSLYNITSIPGTEWYWIGKLFSLSLSLLVIAGSTFSMKEVGLTTTQRVGSVGPAVFMTLGLVLVSVLIGLRFADGDAITTETVLYQLTMPGFAEEIAYRGLFLALLHHAMPARRGSFTYWLPAIITTVAFGLWYGLDVEGWSVTFDAYAFIFPFVGGAAFAWMREKTGSLVFPIIGHNASNLAFYLAGMI